MKVKQFIVTKWKNVAIIALLIAALVMPSIPAMADMPVIQPSSAGGLWEVDGSETQLIDANEIDMQTKKIINVVDPAANQDAATKKYVDDEIDADIATHTALDTGVHGAGGDTLATDADIATHAALTATHGVSGTILGTEDVDDTPVDAATTDPVSSNWAFDHEADIEAHYDMSGSTFPASPVDGMRFCHEVTGRKILYVYDLDNTTWVPIESIGAMTTYVSTTGTDDLEANGHASGSDAFLTVQFAIDCIPGLVGGDVNIYIGTGTFADTITVQGKSFTGSYSINIYGDDFSDTSLTIDAATQGTDDTVTYGTITDNGEGWGLRATLESGNTDGIGAEASVLEDTGQNFLTTCRRGMSVKNTDDDTWAKITNVVTNTRLVLDTDIMDDGEDYIIGWPEHKGTWITFADATDTVALQGDTYLILENDSDTLTIVGMFDAVPTAADTAYISTLQTIISGKITIKSGQLGINFYRLDVDAGYYQVTTEALSVSTYTDCDIKSIRVSGAATFTRCFIHKEGDTKTSNRLVYADVKFSKCDLTSCIIDGEGLHWSTASTIYGIDAGGLARLNFLTLPCVVQNFYPKAGVTNYGIYMRMNAIVAMWHGGNDADSWIRFCNTGLWAVTGAIGQFCIDYTVYEENDADRTVDAATFAAVT